MTTKNYGNEYDWSLGTCSSNQGYADNMEHTEECCLNAGEYTLKCKNAFDDGWNGGFLTIQGTNYCENFNTGSEEVAQVTVVIEGKYGLFRFECLSLLFFYLSYTFLMLLFKGCKNIYHDCHENKENCH